MTSPQALRIESALTATATIAETIEKLEETVDKARIFRKQLRGITNTPKNGSVVQAVRATVAANEKLSEKLKRANEFRADLRALLGGLPKSASVTVAVRELQAKLAAAEAAAASAPTSMLQAKLDKANEFRADLRALLGGLPKSASVTVAVRNLLAENAELKAKQAALSSAFAGLGIAS